MPDRYRLIRRALFQLPAETAHTLALSAVSLGLDRLLLERPAQEPDPPVLGQRLWGLRFSNPLGLAAGFDKDARIWRRAQRWGFGFVEIGTVTPRPQSGNPKPRLFRLDADEAIVNRLGFNGAGLDRVMLRLPSKTGRTGVLGVNIGKNRDSRDAVTDYKKGIIGAAGRADYLVVNVSSPNTPGLRDLQHREALDSLLRHLLAARDRAGTRVPLLLKIAPDLTPDERRDIAALALHHRLDGLVVANTTTTRPPSLRSRHAGEEGGLSGRPLYALSTALLGEMYELTGGSLPLIGVGGVASADDAYEKIRAGASLVQIHTALIFAGPAIVGRIKQGLGELLHRDGFASINEAVGAARRQRLTAS